jgi:hypothetical protein
VSNSLRGIAKKSRAERVEQAQQKGDSVDLWARRHFAPKFGDRAARMAAVCRREGLRDLVVPLEAVAECVPSLADKVPGCLCTHGTTRVLAPRTSYKTALCRSAAVALVVTDSGLVSFYCAEHVETAVVRMPS